MYHYKAVCNKIIDGDTIDATIDLGFDVLKHEIIRLKGLDTPESRTTNKLEKMAGLKVKQFLMDTIQSKEFYISIETTSEDNEKFGRYLGEIFLNESDTISLNKMLLDKGYARPYNGEKKATWTQDVLKKIIEG